MAVEQVGGGAANFVAAARGWRHQAWQADYYPPDLPTDWQLSYYSNEFRAVVVPAEYWPSVDALEVARWLEDTDAEFRFYLEVTDLRSGWDDFAALVAPLAEQTGGILLRPKRCDVDLAQLEFSLQRARQLAPVSVILPPGLTPGDRRLLEDSGVNTHWSAGQGRPHWSPGPLVLALADETARTPRQWREVVENCLNFAVDNDTVLLMMEGEAPDVEALRMTTMIADMLTPAAESLR